MTPQPEQIELNIPEILRRFDPDGRRTTYFDLLLSENRRVNLVSRETSTDDLTRLTAESLLPLSLLPAPSHSYLDIGSGGGLPAVPVLLSGRVQGTACLIERTQKKASALQRILLALDLRATVLADTFEQARIQTAFDLVTMRLVKLNRTLLNRVIDLLEPHGHFVYWGIPDFDCPQLPHVSYSYAATNDRSTGHLALFTKN